MEAARQSQFIPPQSQPVNAGKALRATAMWAPALITGLLLRLWLVKSLFLVNGDSLMYGELAKNLLHGHYDLTLAGGRMVPSLIRLPGYPLFLAGCFTLFGVDNYFAPVLVQIVLELVGCALLADFAGRVAPARLGGGARWVTLWIAALCPFTASYAVLPLAETPTLFALSLAMWAMARFCDRPGWGTALTFTVAVSYTALLRPDGVLAVVAFVPALVWGAWRSRGGRALPAKKLGQMAVVCVLVGAAPFAAWTWRNWRTFHVLEPLAPRYAVDPGQSSYPGWQRWVKTWCLDFVSTYNVYWPVPGEPLDLNELPSRAFDSPAQYAETAALVEKYNVRDHAQDLKPDVDRGLAKLAQERIAAHPLRYYLWLPLGRLADMWLRPRVENLNIDLDWWVYAHHRAETRFSWEYAGLNVLYIVIAAIGLWLRPRFWKALLAYIVLRSALLLTVEAPETRYTLECFPMIFALGGIGLYWLVNRVCLLVGRVKASPGRA